MIASLLSVWVALAHTAAPDAPAIPAKRKIAIIGVELDPQARRASVQSAKVAELAALRNQKFEVKNVAGALDAENEKARSVQLSSAREAMARGRGHFDKIEIDEALAEFERAATVFEKCNLTKHFRQWALAVQFRVATRFLAGDAGTARADLAKLGVAEPRLDLDKSIFSSEVLNAARQAKADLANAPHTDFEVKSEPVSARVFLDGSYIGATPMTVSRAIVGEHFITLEAPGFQLFQEKVRVVPGTVVRAALIGTESKARYLALNDRLKRVWRDTHPSRFKPVQEIGEWLGVDEVLLVGVGRENETLVITAIRIATSDGHMLGVAEEAMAEGDMKLLQRLDQVVTQLLESERPRSGGKAVTFTGPAFRWTRHHTAWSVAGAGAASIATGGMFAWLAYSDWSAFKKLPQTNANTPILRSRGATRAKIADTLLVSGAVVGAVGGYLIYRFRSNDELPAAAGDETAFVLPGEPPSRVEWNANDTFIASISLRF